MSELDRYLSRLEPGDDMEAHRRQVQAMSILKEVFLSLVKHGKTMRLYGTRHHMPRRFLDAFMDNLERFLEEFELLMVEVMPDGLLYNGQSILGADSGSEQLAYGLYSESVRSLSVERGVERRELMSLAELLSRDWLARDDEEDDFVANAWRSDFQKVHVDVADRFSEEDELGEAIEREDLMIHRGRGGGKDRRTKTGDSVLVPEIQGLLRELQAGAGDDGIRMKQDEVKIFLKMRDDLADVPEAGGDEELIALDHAGASAQLAEVFFELLRLDGSADGARQVGLDLARHTTGLIEQGLFADAAALVRRALALLDGDLFPGFRFAQPLRGGYAHLISERNGERLLTALRRRPESASITGPMFTVFSPLPLESVPALVKLGAGADKVPELRQVLADVVVTLLHHDGAALFQLLEQSVGEDALVPLMALARVDFPPAVEACLMRAGDPAEQVRETALRSLRRYQSPNLKQAMIKALDDPATSVRVEALRYLAVYRDAAVLDELAFHMRSDGFGKRDAEEVKAWMMSYGIIGRDAAVPLLRDLGLGSIKTGGDGEIVRSMAVRGLHATRAATARVALRAIGREHPALRGLIQSLGRR